jgi:hypothetical protein
VAWSFIARNRAGSALGELRNVHDRNVRYPWLRTDTMTGRIDTNHPLATRILDGDLTIVSGYDRPVEWRGYLRHDQLVAARSRRPHRRDDRCL